MRAQCLRCHRPRSQCVCPSVRPVNNRCAISILQHPREKLHPLGTARLLRLALRQVDLEVCYQLTSSGVRRRCAEEQGLGVLFPHAQAVPLRSCIQPVPPPTERLFLPPDSAATERPFSLSNSPSSAQPCPQPPGHPLPQPLAPRPPTRLIVLDGTWSHARSLYRHNAWLHGLPHYSIDPDGIDRYRIRKEPKAHYTSTVEAVVHALQIIEPDTLGLDGLLAAFVTMIDRQIAAVTPAAHQPRRRRLLRPRRPVPQIWESSAARQVLVYCEFVLHRGAAAAVPIRQLVYVAAFHRATARLFHAAVQQQADEPPLKSAHLADMALPQAALQAALSREQLRRAWQDFCPPSPLYVAWNGQSLQVAQGLLEGCETSAMAVPGPPTVPHLVLKTLYCNARRRPSGHLEEVLAREGLVAEAPLCPGRAGRRLGGALALCTWLDALAAKKTE
jgi:DTW domain-containing protein YfiP